MPGQATVTIRDRQWTCSVANTYTELVTGLSDVPSMPAGTGMLFDFGVDYKTIQIDMTRMLFPLDIVFINSTQGVVGVMQNVQPGEIAVLFENVEYPGARCFLEVNAGEAQGIEDWDPVNIQGYAQPTQLDISSLMNFMLIMVFVVMMFKMVDRALEEPKERLLPQTLYWPETKGRVVFIGSCKVSEGLCLTHNYSVGKTVRCPKSPLTDEEWKAAWELVETAFPEGMSNPWVNGWWPETLEEAQGAVNHYAYKMRDAVWLFREKQRKAVENYERAGDKAIYNYRQYVMMEYERRPKEAEVGMLPETATMLNGLQIVKAYKQVSAHGEDKISVSLQAWTLFPRGRRPHFISMYRSGDEYVITPLYAHISEWVHVPVTKVRVWIKSLPVRHFEPMAVAPEYREEAERLAREVDEPMAIIPLPSMARQPAVIPTKPSPETSSTWEERLGDCYRLAWRFIMKEKKGWLVHGEVYAGTPLQWIGHAWVELPSDIIYEPVADAFYRKQTFYDGYKAKELRRYTSEEAAIMGARSKNFGPWTDQERKEYLKEKRPAVIPIKPSPPSPKQELEFVSDSPEYLAYTIEDIGYREKLDTAFQTAIARAKGAR